MLFLAMVDNDEARSLLTDLYDKYRGGLFRCVYRLIGNAQDAEDIVHDVFCAAAANEDKLLVGSELFRRRFLFVCARNRSIDYVKKRSRVMLVSEPRETDLVRADKEFEDLLSDNDALKKAMNAVKQLAPPYSNVLYMHLEGWTVAEMADFFGVKSETVRKQLYRAKKQLREAVLNGKDEDQ